MQCSRDPKCLNGKKPNVKPFRDLSGTYRRTLGGSMIWTTRCSIFGRIWSVEGWSAASKCWFGVRNRLSHLDLLRYDRRRCIYTTKTMEVLKNGWVSATRNPWKADQGTRSTLACLMQQLKWGILPDSYTAKTHLFPIPATDGTTDIMYPIPRIWAELWQGASLG